MRSLITGTGAYAPSKVLDNAYFEKIVETTSDWIVERTGIKERRQAAPEEATSDMAVAAAQKALEMAKTDAKDVDLIVVGTITGDMPWPSTAAVIQGLLGNKKAFAFDVSAACSGSLYALSIADRYVSSGVARKALVIGAETLTRIVDWTDRNTCILFGDAAGAMVVEPTDDPKRGIQSIHLHTDGSQWNILHQAGPGSRNPLTPELLEKRKQYLFMNGREVFKFAVRALQDACHEALAANKLTAGDVDHVIVHQANKRIIDATLERLEVPREKCWMNLERYGNTSAASVPTTLDEANRAGRIKPGETILVCAIGAGMAWGAGVIRW
ncbi:MAG TPA: beta-ketoacyl-ACP synthase III [Anaeromyxobacteraceae bacterium]|nr:beta-ketoacyl-ACP synthase III [Anaeromyxobacteraceae bacterium]